MIRFILYLTLLFALPIASGQDAPAPVNKQEEALQSLAIEITKIEEEIDVDETNRLESPNSDEQATFTTNIETKKVRLETLKIEFISVAANVDLSSAGDVIEEPLTLSGEVTSLLRPLIDELKDATSGPRDMEALRAKINEAEERQGTADTIVSAIKKQAEKHEEEPLASVLKERLKDWQKKANDAKLSLEVLELQLSDLEAKSVPIVDSLSAILQNFFRNRGLHLLIALLVFGLTLFFTEKGCGVFQKISPLHRAKGRSLSTRILDLIFLIAGFAMALSGAILVLYLANDWVLLTLVLLFIIGALWVGKQALPKIFDQMKLMLNLGAIREGERVIFEGLPWEVKNINVYTDLVNPALTGGVRRLPIKDLLELRSRVSDSEEWFPCSNGDWLILSDETYGRVVEQTPEYVEIIQRGGARKFYPTPAFLEMAPMNLSRNFRIRSTFGIDYSHQAISTTEVPSIFEERITKELVGILGLEAIKNISVQFKSAGASSLDYEILADFTGQAASKYSQLHRTIQRICVDVCNEQNWVIPFTQITVHQMAAE